MKFPVEYQKLIFFFTIIDNIYCFLRRSLVTCTFRRIQMLLHDIAKHICDRESFYLINTIKKELNIVNIQILRSLCPSLIHIEVEKCSFLIENLNQIDYELNYAVHIGIDIVIIQ